jgi:hypothetical protein
MAIRRMLPVTHALKDEHGHAIVAAHGHGRCIHHAQFLGKHFLVRHSFISYRVGVLERILVELRRRLAWLWRSPAR